MLTIENGVQISFPDMDTLLRLRGSIQNALIVVPDMPAPHTHVYVGNPAVCVCGVEWPKSV